MGNALRKKKIKKRRNLSSLPPLSFYETSMEHWAFGEQHVDAICDSLQQLHLHMMEEIIFEYLGKTKKSNITFIRWNHPNYSTFIHTKNTPLDDEFKLVAKKKSKSKKKSVRPEYKVVIFGSSKVGKTALIRRLAADEFIGDTIYEPHIEDSYCSEIFLNVTEENYDKNHVSVEGTDRVFLDFFDTNFQDIGSLYYNTMSKGQIFILVFDVSDQTSFEDTQIRRERILNIKDDRTYPMIAVGNKCDLRSNGNHMDNGVNMDKVYEWCQKFQIPYIETSAKEGINVNFLFRHCIYEYRAWMR